MCLTQRLWNAIFVAIRHHEFGRGVYVSPPAAHQVGGPGLQLRSKCSWLLSGKRVPAYSRKEAFRTKRHSRRLPEFPRSGPPRLRGPRPALSRRRHHTPQASRLWLGRASGRVTLDGVFGAQAFKWSHLLHRVGSLTRPLLPPQSGPPLWLHPNLKTASLL